MKSTTLLRPGRGARHRVANRRASAAVALVVVVSAGLAPVHVELGAPASARSGSGLALGTVPDLTWGVSRAEVDRTVEAIRDAGIGWVRAGMNWAGGEPDAKGTLNEGWLREVDYAIGKAVASGLQVLMPIADGVPYWASADPQKYGDLLGNRWNKYWRPANVSDYADFAGAMVTRYKALGVHVFEVWNEPNHPLFWPSGPDAVEYTALLKAAYPAIKAADPTATVLLGGLSKNDYDYLQQLYAAGAKPFFDVAVVHPYTGDVDPTFCWNQGGTTRLAKDAFCGIEEVRRTMEANGDSAKAIWLTEIGWSTTNAEYGISEDRQADFMTKALNKTLTYPYVHAAFIYNFRNTFQYLDDPLNIEANFGLIRTDFTAKKALAAVKAFASSLPLPTLSISNVSVVETAPGTSATADFRVSLSAPSTKTVTVRAATANSSAAAGSDYTALAPTTVSFAPGETAKTVTVPVTGDTVAEGDETFVLDLSSPVAAVVADSRGVGTILDDEGLPTISVNNVTVVEGAPGGTATADFRVSLSAPATKTVTVRAATANSSAAAGSDYTALAPTTVSFAPGETARTVTVPVTGDNVAEVDETFLLDLSAPVVAVMADSRGVGTILDDEGLPAISINDVMVGEVAPGATASADFTVSLSAPSTKTVTVRAATANSSAAAGSDYTALAPTTVSFAPGETAKTVTVPVTGDNLAEGNETFVLDLSASVAAVVADPQGVGTILDDEGLPAISVSNVTVAEGAPGGTATAGFTVSLSAPAAKAVTVTAATANGSAAAGSDYTALAPTTVSFPPGETARTVTVPVTGDNVAEGDETFVLNLSASVAAVVADAQGLATVADDDGLQPLLGLLGAVLGATLPPTISVANATVVEGAPGGTATANFRVSLSAPATETVTVKAATANSSATAGSDYTALAPTTVSFAPGETAKTVTVPVTGDTVAEGDETFVLDLSSPVAAVVADSRGVGTILDDEGLPAISINNVLVGEGATAHFTVSLSAPSTRTVTVRAATANSSATAGRDYTALAATTVSFAPGETAKTVTVPVTGDDVAEGNETFVLDLSSPAAAVVADSRGVATILDDEGLPAISVNNVSVGEGAPGGTATANFTVSLSARSTRTVSVRAATANGSATAGSDYTALVPTTVTFAPGETAKTVAVPVTGDDLAEGNETFVLDLSASVAAVVADSQALATILDEEGLPTISVDNVSVSEGVTAHFTVSLSAPATKTVTVSAATANGSAAAGSDYTALAPTTLTFAPGETAKTVAVPVTGDNVAEGDETFVLNLSASVAAVVADAQGLATIRDRG